MVWGGIREGQKGETSGRVGWRLCGISPLEGTAGVKALRWGSLAHTQTSKDSAEARVKGEGRGEGDEVGEVTEG